MKVSSRQSNEEIKDIYFTSKIPHFITLMMLSGPTI